MEIDLPVQPIDLTEEERLELEKRMDAGYQVFVKAAAKLYGRGSCSNVKRLRKEYLEGNAKVLKRKRACAMMAELQSLELRIMAGYIRIAVGYVKSVYLTNQTNHPDLSVGDYMTEAMWGIWDAIYTYDGERGYRFASFVGGVVKNRLINFIRSEERTAGISRQIKRLRRQVKELIRDKGMDTEEALDYLVKEEEIDTVLVELVRQSMALFVSHTALVTATTHHEKLHQAEQELSAMREAIELADLTPLERELVEAHLDNDRGYRSRMSQERINPNTGKLYTKMALTHVWQRACGKIQEVYEGKRKVA
jgi:DNA-directed RNA polymerase specialized sigma subunit